MNIYPAIDMMNGRAVRLRQGRAADVTEYGDPIEIARRFEADGAEFLHMVDLDAAFSGEAGINRQTALNVAHETTLKVELGGGIRDMDAIDALLTGGIHRVILGTVAITQPELVTRAIAKYGPERVAVGIDARDGNVAVKGWVEGSGVDAAELASRMRDAGVRYIIYTDISRDGMLTGPNTAATRRLVRIEGLSIIASGGMSAPEDVDAVRAAGCEGVIIGKALYEGRIDLRDALRRAQA